MEGFATGMSQPVLRCPRDLEALDVARDALICATCGSRYPVVNGTPVLIDETRSLFNVADTLTDRPTMRLTRPTTRSDVAEEYGSFNSKLTLRLQWAHLPNRHLDADGAIRLMQDKNPDARILVVGAGRRRYEGHVTYTDVAMGPDIACICDGHDLPFDDGSFDGVVAAAVLEHVMDPIRCVAEMQRVLAPGGFVYAVTPFMQPVHMGRHDFTRRSYLGHRRLFGGLTILKAVSAAALKLVRVDAAVLVHRNVG